MVKFFNRLTCTFATDCTNDQLVLPKEDALAAYGAEGNFLCPDGQYLSLEDGSEINVNDYGTVCTADATWENEDTYVCLTGENFN